MNPLAQARSFAAALVLPALLAAAVAQAPPATPRIVPYPIDLPPAFQKAIENGTRTATGRPGPKHWTNYARYHLEAELDPKTAKLTGKATMTYVNRSPAALDRLVIHCYQDLMKAGAPRTRTVTATNGLEIQEVRLAGKPVRGAPRDTLLTVRLPTPLPTGGETTVEIDYAFDVPLAMTAPRMGHESDRVYYLGYWYPQFAVYDDVEGWVADPHRGNGEFYMDYADYELAITAPVGYLVRATGELQNPADVLTQRARDALDRAAKESEVVHVIDASDHEAGTVTMPSATGKLTWIFKAENVRDAAVSIARTYLWDATHAVVKDKHGPGKDGTCMIHAVYEANSGDWVRAAEYARHTIEYLSAKVHPYPWPHMTACEGIIGGGMEYPMMTLCGGRQPRSVIFHELTHMWFPMLVGSNEKRHAWQDEGFTSFWTTLCSAAWPQGGPAQPAQPAGGDASPEGGDGAAAPAPAPSPGPGGRSRRGVTGPRGDILAYANTIARGGDVSCMRHADAYGGDNFTFSAYGKPAAILHQLRALLGDDTFFAAFRRYAADWAYKHPYPYDFFRTFSDVARQDLDPYFRTWFYETWTLDHAIADVETKDGGTLVTIEDRGRAVHPCVVEVKFADGRSERQTVPTATWWQGTKATLRFSGDAIEVTLDPDVTSLDCNRDNGVWKKKP